MIDLKRKMLISSLSLLAFVANAGSVTTTFGVSAVTINQCVITATSLAFGNYDPTLSTDASSTNSVAVLCTTGNAYTIALDAGTTSSATISQRLLTDGSGHTLRYNIYSDSSHSTIWGNSTTGSLVSGTGSGILQTYTGYGLIPKNQVIPTGTYTDLITATLTF